MEPRSEAPIDIYARVSRKGDKQQRSTTGQAQVCRGLLEARGLPVGETWVDDGRSAWNPRVRRPGWEALMLRLESGAAGGVIVFDLERFTRQPSEGERLIKGAERGLTVLDSDAEFDLASASGKKAFRDAMAAAAYYSDRLSDRVSRGKRLKAASGAVDGRRAFGFEQDGVTFRAAEVAIIRDHAARLLAGEPQDTLLAELEASGVAPVRGAPWGRATYRKIMTRPRNVGLLVHKGEVMGPILGPDGEPIPAILDETTHARLVALYAGRRAGRPPSGRYVLTGLAACGRCGAGLSGRPITKSPSGRRQYWCRKCSGVFVTVSRLDDWAGEWAIRTLADPEQAEARAEAEREAAEARSRLEAEAGDIESQLIEIAGRLGRREISLARHDAICGPLETRVQEIQAELAALAAATAARRPEPRGAGRNPVRRRDAAYLSLLAEWAEAEERGDAGNAVRRAIVARALAGRRIVVAACGSVNGAKFDESRVTVT